MHTTLLSAPAAVRRVRARVRSDRSRDSGGACPACGRRDALLALGSRYEHPHRWRPWVIRRTPLYPCAHCTALVAGDPTREPVVDTARQSARSTAPHPPWFPLGAVVRKDQGER